MLETGNWIFETGNWVLGISYELQVASYGLSR